MAELIQLITGQPAAIALAVVIFWFFNQNMLEFNKKYLAVIDLLFEERKQWTADLRVINKELLDALNRNTEAQSKNASETHGLINTIAPLVLAEQQQRRSRNERPRTTGGADGD